MGGSVSGSGILRVLVAEWPENQFFNLAFEEVLYLESKLPTLRFWRNDKVVVIGRFQSPPLEINSLEARDLGIKLVRRFTGGGAVYHDLGNVNYALTLPNHKLSIEESFSVVASAVVEALGSLGVSKAYYRPLNDIEVDGLKISGMAACRTHDRVFVHGAMLVSSDISILWRVLKISREKLSDKKFTQSRVKRVTTVNEVLGRTVSPEELYKAISEALSRRLGLEVEWGAPDNTELRKALNMYKGKYATLEWNLKYVDEVRDLISDEEYEALKAIARPSKHQERFIEVLSLE
ncbi:MAG: lipoate--protein ligase family protein [Desulfurococcaceae archaeon]|nr:lipoate--protein ligase family protein [Desulfurococcaceae archaeon]